MNVNLAMRTVLLLLMTSRVLLAQKPDAVVAFGSLRVPACTVSADPEYGLKPTKPIQLGGGPAYAAARMARYIGALRGPQGQTVRLSNTRGSLFAPMSYWDEPTILDGYQVSYDGQPPTGLYVDTYHFSLPKAPMGFTCGGPLVTALGMPPLDPLKANSSIVALAIAQGTAKEPIPVPLDLASARGYLLDQFTTIAFRARAAAASGAPMEPTAPPATPDVAVPSVLASPVTCAGRSIAPQAIEVMANQAVLPLNGDFIRDEAIGKTLPGVPVPAGSLAARFRQGQVTQIKITYAEPCEGNSADVSLPIRIEPPRITARPGVIPAGIVEADPTIYLQVILDTEGRFVNPLHIGGPKSLVPTAIETIDTWRAEPVRINGTPVINPMILQVIFR
jgi:hypothetical protein